MRRPAEPASGAPARMRVTLPYIEGVRGAAALYVVLGHLCTMSAPRVVFGYSHDTPAWLMALMAPFWYGHLAVAAFIVVSGFCLQMSLFDRGDGRLRSAWRFFGRRAKRILPAYYACLAVSLVVSFTVTSTQLGLAFRQYLPVTRENTLAHVFLIHNWSPEWMYKINGVLWSIATEVQLYLLFPLLVAALLWLRRPGFLLLVGGIAAWQIGWHPEWAKLYVWYIALFGFGMIAAHAAFKPNLRRGVRPVRAGGWGMLLAAAAIVAISQTREIWPSDLLMGSAIACWLYTGAVSPRSLPARAFGWAPLAFLGIFSYSLYLMHHPIQQIMYVNRPAWATGTGMELLYLAVVALPVILVGSAAFFWIFERPFLTRRVKAAKRTDLTHAAAEFPPYPLVEAPGAPVTLR